MIRIRVSKTLNAPIDKVFDILSDHAGYSRFRGVDESTLLRPGRSEQNGIGAQRQIRIGRTRVIEHIVGYRRPDLLEYKITEMKPVRLVEHKIGRVQLSGRDDGRTDVLWTSEGRVSIPLLGWLLGPGIAAQFERGFHGMLNDIERLANDPHR